MEDFTAYNPVKLHFGKDVLNKLGKAVNESGKKVLLVYGGGSIKKNGVYEKVIDQLNSINAEIIEFPGIKPNPIIEDVDAAAQLAREKQIDVIVAAGGGSVIDSAKVISIGVPVNSNTLHPSTRCKNLWNWLYMKSVGTLTILPFFLEYFGSYNFKLWTSSIIIIVFEKFLTI